MTLIKLALNMQFTLPRWLRKFSSLLEQSLVKLNFEA